MDGIIACQLARILQAVVTSSKNATSSGTWLVRLQALSQADIGYTKTVASQNRE
jgi:hypothetical protein